MRSSAANILLCLVLCYFAYHALVGDQGLARWTQLQKNEKALSAELLELRAEKQEIKDRIKRLRPETLDLDYVEEIARKKLAYAREDEYLVVVE